MIFTLPNQQFFERQLLTQKPGELTRIKRTPVEMTNLQAAYIGIGQGVFMDRGVSTGEGRGPGLNAPTGQIIFCGLSEHCPKTYSSGMTPGLPPPCGGW